jgi:hypothetical protein
MTEEVTIESLTAAFDAFVRRYERDRAERYSECASPMTRLRDECYRQSIRVDWFDDTVDETAAGNLLDLSPKYLKNLRLGGRPIAVTKQGKHWRYTLQAILEYRARQAGQGE